MNAAGVTIAIARGCSAGQLANCGCDSRPFKLGDYKPVVGEVASWKWGGCSHNLRHGLRFSRLFLDVREKGAEDLRSNVIRHNNQVGRLMVSGNMQVKCKCHGMSGSCELKTCWRAVPDLEMVGQALKEKFRAAVLVDQNNMGRKNVRKFNSLKPKKNPMKFRPRHLTGKRNRRRRNLSKELLFYQQSPSFCEADISLDIPGTSGRACNRTSRGIDGCGHLCCDRGYDLIKRRRVERCYCRFIWCCQVECQTCVYEEWVSVCK